MTDLALGDIGVVMRLLAASQVVLFVAVVLRARLPARTKALVAMLAAGVLSYLFLPLADGRVAVPVSVVAGLVSNTIPALLFVLAWEFFEDAQPTPGVWAVLVLTVFGAMWLAATPDSRLALTCVQVLKLAVAAAGLWLVWRGHAADLVDQRRRLRRLFVGGVGVLVVAVVFAELVAQWQVPMALEALGMAVIFLFVLTVNVAFLTLEPDLLVLTQIVAPVSAVQATDDPLVAELERLLREERLYADHDLRIGQVAERLRVPEYRLRKTINGRLGHRNFNRYVNGYRIEEAAARLLSDSRLPVLTIALDVGFRSISSFNAAFREIHGCTPTEYRAARHSGAA